MHSALPMVRPDLNGSAKGRSGPWHPRMVRVGPRMAALLILLGLFVVISGFLSFFSGMSTPPYRGETWTGALTVQETRNPIIHPDLSRLAEYRTSQKVTLTNGDTVDSSRHSYKYTGPKPGPEVILVMGINSEDYSQEYLEMVLADRIAYANAHGYGLYARYMNDAILANGGSGIFHEDFVRVVLTREAMHTFPDAKWIWYLDQDAVIMRHEFDLVRDFLSPETLKNEIQRDIPVWPPDGIVHTYKRVPADQFRFFATQNDRGVATASFVLSNDNYGRYVTSYWLDPLHQQYQQFGSQPGMNRHIDNSVTHMLQWHPTMLSRFAYVKHENLLCSVKDGNVVHDQSYRSTCAVKLLRNPNEERRPDTSTIATLWKSSVQERKGTVSDNV